MKVKDIMSIKPILVDKDQPITTAMQLFKKKKISRLIVLEDKQPIGILTKKDVARVTGTSRKGRLTSGRIYVSTAMSRKLLVVNSELSAVDAARLMSGHDIGGLPVVDGDKLMGVVTKSDFLPLFEQSATPVSTAMTLNPETVHPENKIAFARELMVKKGYSHIPVVSAGTVKGILSEGDIADAFEILRRTVESKYHKARIEKMLVEDIMSAPSVSVFPKDQLKDAVKKMEKQKIDAVTVVENNELVGILTKSDLIKFL